MVEVRMVSNVTHRAITHKGSTGGLHEVVWINENVEGDKYGSRSSGSKVLGIGMKPMKENVKKGLRGRKPNEGRLLDRNVLTDWVQNTPRPGEDFGATNGSIPIHIHDPVVVSLMEQSLGDKDRSYDMHATHVPTHVAGHEDVNEGRP
ncbi:hypothetical protein V6N13_028988 [Hibiscus sabdariffa]